MKHVIMGLSLFAAFSACKNEPKKVTTVATPPVVTTPAPPAPTPAPPAVTTAIPTPATSAQTTCYQLVTKTKEVHTCQITQDANGVSGYFDWAPFEKDGGHGILRKGKMLGKDTLTAEYLFMIEGSTQIMEAYFLVAADKLTELSAPLTDLKGSNPIKSVVKDRKALKPRTVMPKVDCAKTASVVKMIQEMKLK
ncbi:MAG: hypothetical protein RL329_2533 [Bacteroidota bacterium]|jgi:hypothetical protein